MTLAVAWVGGDLLLVPLTTSLADAVSHPELAEAFVKVSRRASADQEVVWENNPLHSDATYLKLYRAVTIGPASALWWLLNNNLEPGVIGMEGAPPQCLAGVKNHIVRVTTSAFA